VQVNGYQNLLKMMMMTTAWIQLPPVKATRKGREDAVRSCEAAVTCVHMYVE
jgi:hypothetical protein